ncbi:MAG: hypothetical protein IMW98_05765 [Firmicutes bacterium]|nr:hypothetical protein [Bacillota bacterium]
MSGTNHPRIACVHPDGSPYAGGKPYRIIGNGQFYKYRGWSSGVATAAILDAGRPGAGAYRSHPNLIVQDLRGGLYRFDPQTGNLLARTDALATPGDLTIAAPAVYEGIIVAVGHGWNTICILSEYNLEAADPGHDCYDGLAMGLRPPTIIEDARGPDIGVPAGGSVAGRREL